MFAYADIKIAGQGGERDSLSTTGYVCTPAVSPKEDVLFEELCSEGERYPNPMEKYRNSRSPLHLLYIEGALDLSAFESWPLIELHTSAGISPNGKQLRFCSQHQVCHVIEVDSGSSRGGTVDNRKSLS